MMYGLFVSKQEIQKGKFLEKWRESEHGDDQFALNNLKKHEHCKGLRYYAVVLTEDGLNNLILPFHNHPDTKVAVGGEPFWDVVSKYSVYFEVQKGKFDACLQRVYGIKGLINQSDKYGNLLEAKFIFVSNDRGLAIPGPNHYKDHGENKLYAGNFHQFVAYGLWVKENCYKPIKTYYCEKA